MHIYAFFTSCLNVALTLQNEKEAHKLLILQPMIEKHITELKMDQLALQANCASDLFEIADQTLSSIGAPSNTSYASINNTTLNQISSSTKTITPQRNKSLEVASPQKLGGLIMQRKMAYMQSLLTTADQVLHFNCLKHKLIEQTKRVVKAAGAPRRPKESAKASPVHTTRGFEAEDGIRDSPQSRGLGDVYKRQEQLMGLFFVLEGQSHVQTRSKEGIYMH